MCPGNEVTDANGFNQQNNCVAATGLCPPPYTTGFYVFGKAAGDPGPYKRVADNQCFGTEVVATVADVRAALEGYLKTAQFPAAAVTVQPAGPGLAQLPVIAYAQSLNTVTLSTDVGVPATITAIPHYVWNFGDPGGKATNVADWPGQGYTGVSPRDRPQDYITHTYTQKGTYPIGVTIRWEATFQIEGIPNVLPLNPEVRAEPALAYQVLEARAVLTGNG